MAMSSVLIRKLNTIQDVFSSLGYEPIELPKIVVVGTQSAGKSSVLESLVKRSFLPRGKDLVTRCPLVLQLYNCPLGDRLREAKDTQLEEWGEFNHAEGKIFEISEIRDEIERQTEVLAPGDKCIVKHPITLKVYSPFVVNLTLVDLPGITKVPVGDQPHDIEDQIHELIYEQIANPTAIILAVITANTDMATNESLKLAKNVDPKGERTLAVVTKLDLMDKGTDARAVLTGDVIKVELGIVGVVNRSQQDIIDDKSMEDAHADERKFFQSHYPDLASRSGTTYLASRLSDLLGNHINTCLPAVKVKMQSEVQECLKVLFDLGESVTDKKAALMSLINDFTRTFARLCETGPQDMKARTLIGGAKICDILHSQLEKTFSSFDPCKEYDEDQVIMAIRQSNGLKPPFFVSEPAFEMLIKPQILKMEQPALACVEAVKVELGKVCREAFSRQLSMRFPSLKQELLRVVESVIEKHAAKAIEMIKNLIAIETGHITYYRIDALKEDFQKVLSNEGNGEYEIPFNPGHRKSVLRSMIHQHKGDAREEIQRQIHLLEMSAKDEKHVIILGKMLEHYFKIVQETMQDSTAKTVVTFYVNVVKESLNSELCVHLMKDDHLDELFYENDDVTFQRETYQKRRRALDEALKVLAGDC